MSTSPLGLPEVINRILGAIKQETGFEALGIRLRDGDDFPYYVTDGFSEAICRAERSLCTRDTEGTIARDGQGNPVLECMCGNILAAGPIPRYLFFTPGGSFWTNSATHLSGVDHGKGSTDRDPQPLQWRRL